MSKAFKAKAKAEREIRGDHVLQYSMLRDYVVELQSTNPNTTVKIAFKRNTDPSLPTRVFQRIYVCLGALKLSFRACRRDLLGLDGAFMKGTFPGQCLGDDIDLHPNSNFTFISDRQKGIIPAIKTVYPVASAANVRDFEKCMLELKTMNPKAHEWLNKIPAEHWARSHFSGRAKSDLLLNNICEVFNGKIVGGRDKPVITLLEYIREYCMKRIVNVQGVIDKCTGPLTPTATRIMESIKKEAYFMKVQWNRANKYQVSGSLGDQCVDVVSMTCSCRKWELTGIPCKHVVAACWNMALNDRAAPPLETWVNPCYWLSTWKETYSHKIQPICGTNYWDKSTCPTTLLPPKHHVQVGRLKKKRKRSKHEDEPFVKDGKLSRKGRTITCQSCRNIRHNNATCKGQGRKATIGSGSASWQAQQTQPAVGQDGSGGSGVGAAGVIGLFAAAGEGGAGDPSGAGVASQGSSHTRWTRRIVQTERISPQKGTPTQPANQPSTSSQVPVTQTRKANGREMSDGVPTQSSAAGGASEWSFLPFRGKHKISLFEIDFTFGINAFDLDKGTDVMKDTVSLKNLYEEEVPLNNNIGKQIGDFVDMPSEAVE
ncbi:crooked neck-like protein 1 [Tanacetum coccineum]